MKTTPIILATAWIATLVAAFTIGSKLNPSEDDKVADRSENREAGRSSLRSASRDREPSAGSRSGGSGDRDKSTSGNEPEIKEIMNSQNPLARTQALIDLINRLGPDEFEQTVADFRGMGITRERMSEYAMLLHAWGKTDPLAALEYAKENTGTPFARQTILASWAEDSPDSAISWANSNHEGEGANPWLIGVIRGIASSNPEKASEIMATLPYSRERGDALSSIVPHIAKLGKDKANEWLNTLEDERLRAGGAAYLADIMAKSNPAEAAEWVLNLRDEEAITRAAGSVADEWAEVDLDAAISWTDSLPEKAKTSAARQVIGHYASEDPAKASAWLSTMSDQEGYQDVVSSYIWNTARENPEMSLSKVAEISDERSRLRYYSRIYDRWQQRDTDSAQAWLQNSQLSEEVKKSIQSRRERGRR
ncbi:MAG: hypothetical protein AB8F34_02375 [Akkermansiaceae bacterium]